MGIRYALAAVVMWPSAAAAAEVSPYVGQNTRTIKALSQADIDGLLQGKGMELALPAELNGYPGPAHVLDLASALALTPTQVATLKPIQERMTSEAKALGTIVVEKERALDLLFAERRIDPQRLLAASVEIGELRGKLRAVHLQAHLETRAALTPQQVARYDVLRGYSQVSGHSGHQPASGAQGHGKH